MRGQGDDKGLGDDVKLTELKKKSPAPHWDNGS